MPNGIALGHYRLLHKQGHADAQNNIGWCYQNGLGVSKDVYEAVRWFRRAVEQGNARAQNNLGWCYQNGLGVAKDVHEAVKWYRKAAKQGNARSQKKLKQLGKSW